jgi:hypothetical protein
MKVKVVNVPHALGLSLAIHAQVTVCACQHMLTTPAASTTFGMLTKQ